MPTTLYDTWFVNQYDDSMSPNAAKFPLKASWQRASPIRRALTPFKNQTQTQLTNFAGASTSPYRVCTNLAVSLPLDAQTISGTVLATFAVSENNAASDAVFCLHLWVAKGVHETDAAYGTLRGTLLNTFEDTTEWPTTKAGVTFGLGPQTLTPVTIERGDVLVVEIGYKGSSSAASFTQSFQHGSNINTGLMTPGATDIQLNGHLRFSTPIAITTPDHDAIDTPRVITALPYTDTVDTLQAQGSSGAYRDLIVADPFTASGNVVTHSVWYQWTCPANGSYKISVDGSDYGLDAIVGVNVFNDIDALLAGEASFTGIEHKDGEFSPSDADPLIFTGVAGTTYQIMVGRNTWGDLYPHGGALVFTLAAAFIAPPVNDACVDALTIGALPYSSPEIDTRGATTIDEPASSGVTDYRTAWWTYTAVIDDLIVVAAHGYGSNNTYAPVTIYAGGCGALTEIRCYPQGRGGFWAKAGMIYFFKVGCAIPDGFDRLHLGVQGSITQWGDDFESWQSEAMFGGDWWQRYIGVFSHVAPGWGLAGSKGTTGVGPTVPPFDLVAQCGFALMDLTFKTAYGIAALDCYVDTWETNGWKWGMSVYGSWEWAPIASNVDLSECGDGGSYLDCQYTYMDYGRGWDFWAATGPGPTGGGVETHGFIQFRVWGWDHEEGRAILEEIVETGVDFTPYLRAYHRWEIRWRHSTYHEATDTYDDDGCVELWVDGVRLWQRRRTLHTSLPYGLWNAFYVNPTGATDNLAISAVNGTSCPSPTPPSRESACPTAFPLD